MTIINAPASNLPAIGATAFAFQPLPSISQIMTMVTALGATVVRVEVPWADTELGKGVYAMRRDLDGWIAACRFSGKQVVLLLDYGNPLYPGSGAWNMPPRDAASCDAFANWAAWLVGQYAAPDVWFEIYNEPNNPMFWANTVNPAQYAALLSACIVKMRAVPGKGASAKIVTAGIGSVAAANDQNPYMAAVASAVGSSTMARLTAHALHPYLGTDAPEGLFAFIDAYRAAAPCVLPIVVTEWGYCNQWLGNDETKRALYTARMIGCAVLAGLPLLTVFNATDTGTDPNNMDMSFGLYRFDLTPKPAVKAFKAMMDALAGAVTYDAEKVVAGSASYYRINVRKADGTVTKIIWSDVPTTSIIESMANVLSVDDTNGSRPWFRLLPGGLMITIGAAIAPQIITGTT